MRPNNHGCLIITDTTLTRDGVLPIQNLYNNKKTSRNAPNKAVCEGHDDDLLGL